MEDRCALQLTNLPSDATVEDVKGLLRKEMDESSFTVQEVGQTRHIPRKGSKKRPDWIARITFSQDGHAQQALQMLNSQKKSLGTTVRMNCSRGRKEPGHDCKFFPPVLQTPESSPRSSHEDPARAHARLLHQGLHSMVEDDRAEVLLNQVVKVLWEQQQSGALAKDKCQALQNDILQIEGRIKAELKNRGNWVCLDLGRLTDSIQRTKIEFLIETWTTAVKSLGLEPARVLLVKATNLRDLPMIATECECIQHRVGMNNRKTCLSLAGMSEALRSGRFDFIHVMGDNKSTCCTTEGLRPTLHVSDDGPVELEPVLQSFEACQGHELVFLSLCGGKPIGDRLIADKRVAGVIAHTLSVNDGTACDFACKFYAELDKYPFVSLQSARSAFEKAKEGFQGSMPVFLPEVSGPASASDTTTRNMRQSQRLRWSTYARMAAVLASLCAVVIAVHLVWPRVSGHIQTAHPPRSGFLCRKEKCQPSKLNDTRSADQLHRPCQMRGQTADDPRAERALLVDRVNGTDPIDAGDGGARTGMPSVGSVSAHTQTAHPPRSGCLCRMEKYQPSKLNDTLSADQLHRLCQMRGQTADDPRAERAPLLDRVIGTDPIDAGDGGAKCMNFGKYALLSYAEVRAIDPGYAAWAVETAAGGGPRRRSGNAGAARGSLRRAVGGGDSDLKLISFVKWLKSRSGCLCRKENCQPSKLNDTLSANQLHRLCQMRGQAADDPRAERAPLFDRVIGAAPIDAGDGGAKCMNFGKYALLSYAEVRAIYPDYAAWAVKTAARGGSDWKLRDFVKWFKLNAPGEPYTAKS